MKLNEVERAAADMWLKGLEEASSDFCTNTKNESMRAYMEGQAEAYGHMRKLIRENEDPGKAIWDYLGEVGETLTKAEEEGTIQKRIKDKCHGVSGAIMTAGCILSNHYQEPATWYAIGVAMDKERETGSDMPEDAFEYYFYKDRKQAEEEFARATNAAFGGPAALDKLLEAASPLTERAGGVGIFAEGKMVRFREVDELPEDAIASEINEPVDVSIFDEVETVECGDGVESDASEEGGA